MPHKTNAQHQGEAAALREALRLTLTALEKAIADGCAIDGHESLCINGQAFTYIGICCNALDALEANNQQEGQP